MSRWAQDDKSQAVSVKLCVIGATAVGKTNIVLRYTQDIFRKQDNTIPSTFCLKYCSAPGGTLFKFEIWDTAGQERFKSLVPMYYRGASVILIVYDISNRDSFIEGVQSWVNQLREENVDDDVILAVVGNKSDLAQLQRQVKASDGRKYAKKINAMFFETSAKTGYNVANMFHEIAARLEENLPVVQHDEEQSREREGTIKLEEFTFDRNPRSRKKCCLR